MNLGFRQIITVLATLCLSIIVPAQDIPVLPDDPAVMKGVMPNGMSYYLVSNSTVKGVADFALVQKTGGETFDDPTGTKAVSRSREALSSLRRLSPSRPQEYLSRHDIAPGRDGFVKVTDDATVFRFMDVSLGGSTLDSTLVVLMDIADRVHYFADDTLSKWYSPSDQAIIVSGDIDSKSVEDKLRSMSYMIPAMESLPRREYSRSSREAVFVKRSPGWPSLAEVSATWTSERVPREYMNTVQPEIFEMSLHTLGEIAVGRVKNILKDWDIPVADVSFSHICSAEHPYDDSFSINAVVRTGDASAALEAISIAMSSIDDAGAGKDEYILAEAEYLRALSDDAGSPVKSNGAYVDRCMNAFLYNSSLASTKERLNFHTSRNLPDTMRQRLFNDIAKAILDKSENLTVASPIDSSEAVSIFNSAWALPETAASMNVNVSDTLKFPGHGSRVRLRSAKKEPVSGGEIWTFSNGFKVIYKRMASDRVHYNLAMNGGFASVSGLESGEGAYVSDYLGTCRISGMDADYFMDILDMEGVTMDVKVNMSNTIISGSIPGERITLLLKSLLAVANERTRDDSAFGYYKDSEYLALDMAQGGFSARMTAIDSIMCPDYRYSPYKVSERITEDFQDKVGEFFDSQFGKMNDGALVLVGDVDAERLKKTLAEFVGGFKTDETAFRRPATHYQPVSGWSTYTVDGKSDIVEVAVSARMPLTMENFIAADLAASILKRNLVRELDDSGMYLTMSCTCRIYPEERINMIISVSEASAEGFSMDLEQKTPIEALADVRAALSGLHNIEVTEDELKPYKESLKKSMSEEMKNPVYWVDAISLRYLEGKDLSSNYAAKIDAVTPDKVMSVLRLLGEGSKVEYVTIKK